MSLSKYYGFEEIKRELFDYEIDHEIGRGGTSVVYVAKGQRGGLCGSIVVVKKKISPSVVSAQIKSSTELHRSLSHPSIVSLLDILSTDHTQYRILEYCPNGTLLSRVKLSPTRGLSEPELRGVVKSIVDGLCYLRKKLVIHRDMNPSNILIGEDWRVKIADFGHAVRVVSETSTVTYRCATSELGYLSPELAAHRPHGFPTDIWSLGAVVITCMRGDHAFGASSPEEINKKIARADYSVPSFVSRELRNLISSLLKVIPRERISLHGISSHPFMNSSLPVVPLSSNVLRLTVTQPTPLQDTNKRNPTVSSRYPPYLSKTAPTAIADLAPTGNARKPLLLSPPDRRITSMPTSTSESSGDSTFSLLKREDLVTRRTASTSQLSRLCFTSSPPRAKIVSSSTSADSGSMTSELAKPLQRQISTLCIDSNPKDSNDFLSNSKSENCRPLDPNSVTPEFLDFKIRARAWRSAALLSTISHRNAAEDLKKSTQLNREMKGRPLVPPSPSLSSLFSSVGTSVPGFLPFNPRHCRDRTSPVKTLDEPPISELPFPLTPRSCRARQADEPSNHERDTLQCEDKPCSEVDLTGEVPVKPAISSLPVSMSQPTGIILCSTKPRQLNTEYLTSNTYKTVKGQVTVLPSKSLLVDLREGERRKGRKGDEVLVVSPNGDHVKVYSAPHLSTPCCLVEPSAEYTYDVLPREYWGRYADAVKAVYQVKQKIPKFIRYTPTAKCTLMANEPYGDVEIVIPSKVDTHTAFNSKQTSSGSRAPTTKLKLRLRQDKRTLEITRHTVSGSSSHYTSSGSNGAQARDGQPGSGTLKSTVIGRGSGSQGFTPRDQDGNNVGMIVTSKKVIPVVIRAGYRMEILGEEGALDEEEVGALGLLGEFLRIMRVLERDVGGVEDCLKEMEKLSVSAGEKRGFQMHDEFENEREKRVVKARKLEEGVGGSRSELGKRPTMAAPSNRTIIAPELPMPGGLGGGVSANAVGGRACAGTTTATSRTASGDSSSSSSLALVHISSPSSSNISITAPQPNPNSYSRPAGTGLGRTALNSNSNSNTLTSRLAIPARPARFPSGSWSWRSRTSTDSSSSSSGSSKSRNTSTSTNEATSNL